MRKTEYEIKFNNLEKDVNNRSKEFRIKYKCTSNEETIIIQKRKPRRIKTKNPEVARRRRKELEEKNKQKYIEATHNYGEDYEKKPFKKPTQKKRKIASRAAAIAASIAIATGGLGVAIHKNKVDDQIDVSQTILTLDEKDEIGVNETILNKTKELSDKINDIEELSNTSLISLAEDISEFQAEVLDQKLSSLFGTDGHIKIERGYNETDGTRSLPRVKLSKYSTKKNVIGLDFMLPSKADKYITSMDEFEETIKDMEKSDIKRSKLIKRLQEEFEMGKDMVNQRFMIDEKGKIKIKPMTDKMLMDIKSQEDEER